MGDMLSFLSPEDLEFMRGDAREAILNLDSVLYGQPPSRPITFIYRRLLTQSVDLGQGGVNSSWDDRRINGYGGHIALHDMTVAGDKIQIGDQFVMFDPTQLGAPVKNDDRVLLYITYDGTVGLTNNSTAVTGFGTDFIKTGVQGGDLLVDCDITNSLLEIASVQSPTALTLKNVWSGVTTPYMKYEIFRSHTIIDNKVDPLLALTRLGLRRAGS